MAMNLATMQFLSKSLGRHVTYTAILPDPVRHGGGPFPVLYQLHGASDDHTAWVHFSRLVQHVAPYPLIVVMPDGALSGWRNSGTRERYEDLVVVDLPRHAAATFHIRPGRAAIGGLSMGGGGAIRLGMQHPDLFASIWGHSSSLPTPDRLRARYGLSEQETAADDVYAIARGLATAPRLSRPVLSFDCGLDDFLLADNRAFHQYLEGLGLPHTYREHPGAHTWEYWDAHVREALVQHAAMLGIGRQ